MKFFAVFFAILSLAAANLRLGAGLGLELRIGVGARGGAGANGKVGGGEINYNS